MRIHAIDEGQIASLVVEQFKQEDISHQIGTKRNVDCVRIVLKDRAPITATLSLDREAVEEVDDSPSFQEAESLASVDGDDAWCVQRFYGLRILEHVDGKRGLICKEFLDGDMLASVLPLIAVAQDEHAQSIRELARCTGALFANALHELGGVPKDSHPMNVILTETPDGDIRARFCDVEEIRTDAEGIRRELALMRKEFGKFGEDFMDAVGSIA